MYTWNNSETGEPKFLKFSTLIIFGTASASALIMAVLLHTYFNDFMVENPVINYILFGPAFGIGFLYGLKISEKALQPSETRSALKRKIIKTFLFFLVIGGLLVVFGMVLNSVLVTDANADKGSIDMKFGKITCQEIIIEEEWGKEPNIFSQD